MSQIIHLHRMRYKVHWTYYAVVTTIIISIFIHHCGSAAAYLCKNYVVHFTSYCQSTLYILGNRLIFIIVYRSIHCISAFIIEPATLVSDGCIARASQHNCDQSELSLCILKSRTVHTTREGITENRLFGDIVVALTCSIIQLQRKLTQTEAFNTELLFIISNNFPDTKIVGLKYQYWKKTRRVSVKSKHNYFV